MPTDKVAAPNAEKPRGRPQVVGSDQVLLAARKMLSERTAASFSIRRLAGELSVAPATLFLRFGTKNELLAQAYLQHLQELRAQFHEIPDTGRLRLDGLVGLLSGPLSELRVDFSVRFEVEGGPVHGVRSSTWRALRDEYLKLVRQVHSMVREAARREGHDLVGGSLAERLVWSLLSSGTSDRNAQVYGHRNSTYFRFLARAIVAALAPAP